MIARRALLALVLGCACGGGGGHEPEPFAPTEATIAYCGDTDDAAVEARITELLGQLTVDDKVSLMHGAALGVLGRVWRVEGLEAHGIPGFRMLDGPRGVSTQSGLTATAFPVGIMRGATWDPDLEREVGAAMARELRSVGGDVLLAPTMNILRHPRWGRAQETYSEDTHHMGAMAVAFIEGVQGEGVLASAKHYAANSIEDTRHEVDVQIDERTLREIYLPHFERAVTEARVASVMSAYNSVNGSWCDQQVHLLTDILKGEWQFAGFVESDWIRGTHGDAQSVLAGLDIEMPWDQEFRNLPAAVAAGELTEHDLDRAVRRILRAQFCYGLDERAVVDDDPTQRETTAHLALAREVARRGAVLLKNQGALPLANDAAIVVMGRNADEDNIGDEGSSAVTPSDVISALQGLQERFADVTHLPGTTIDAAAQATIEAADAVVVVTGLQAEDEGEDLIGGGDRASLEIPADEIALIQAVAAIHPTVIVIVEGGAAFTTASWDGDVEALLHAFYPGSQGGHALADLLSGDHSPSGRLPFSMPESEADLPPFDNVSSSVEYGYFHGYRHLEREDTPARYPFGFGLSYTTFTYGDPTVTDNGDGTLTVEVDVTNTGAVSGIDTVQLYASAPGSRVDRAPADLRAFARVELDPAETQTVALQIRLDDLRFWDEAAGAWELEPLTYELRVAQHSADPGVVVTYTVE